MMSTQPTERPSYYTCNPSIRSYTTFCTLDIDTMKKVGMAQEADFAPGLLYNPVYRTSSIRS